MQVGILHGKVEPDHPERNPARQEANSGRRGTAECVSVPEEPYEGNPHVRFCEGRSRSYGLYPSTRPALQKGETYGTPDDEHTPGNSFLHRSLCYITLYPLFIIVSVKRP